MGQQQLLLLVLGIVIVGLAVVVGIQAFSENKKKANADALVNDAIRIASDAQAWRLKPAAFGGGADNPVGTPWTGLTLNQLGYETTSNVYSNLNGYFELGAVTGATLTITAMSNTTEDGNVIEVVLSGTGPDDIVTSINDGSPAWAAPGSSS